MTNSSRNSLIILTFSPHAVIAQEGERDAPTGEQQDKCQMVWPEKSNNTWPKSHGFALSRTVSCNATKTKEPQKGTKVTKRKGNH
jgi:hypothetical protein